MTPTLPHDDDADRTAVVIVPPLPGISAADAATRPAAPAPGDAVPPPSESVPPKPDLPADVAAAQILAGLNAGEREIVVAEGVEAGALELRRADPATLFAFTAAEGARLAAARAEGQGPEPAKVNT